MRQKKWLLLVLILVLGSASLFKWLRNPSKTTIASIELADIHNIPNQKITIKAVDKKNAPFSHATSNSTLAMSQTLRKFTLPGNKLKDLVQFLKGTRQEPLVSHDANPDTGEMAIVRTRKPLPGTRYFHAQYFSDNAQDDGFVQHMSFEVQPSPEAMNDVVSAMSDSFGLQKPTIERDGYKKWKLSTGYIVWIKKMDRDDLVDDPFNAYSAADIGTIRVAIESDIHGEDE